MLIISEFATELMNWKSFLADITVITVDLVLLKKAKDEKGQNSESSLSTTLLFGGYSQGIT